MFDKISLINLLVKFLHAWTVCTKSILIVIGPTPPGTGVIAETLSKTSS